MKDNFDMTSSCIQGGCPRPINEYHAHRQIGPHSPLAAWQYPPVIQNPTHVLEDRNDSGINSGSDCHSSSPGSENSGEVYTSSSEPLKVAQFSTPIYPKGSYHSSNLLNTLTYSSDNSYMNTPPSTFSNVIKTEPKDEDDDEDTTPTSNSVLKNLEMSVERNLGSSISPGISETSMDDDKKSDHTDNFDENGHRIPRLNSHGKIKTFKCKQCDFQAITKFDFWQHQRHHIKPDKILSCPKCPFVTEYKHHLEYHLRNHEGSKPFKCEHCDYTCVNKSMLNSHKKSHSNIYQYRCANCHYASKYCHSLKLHLRKYEHSPAMVLNPDGSPNPLPIVDVYGTRRGPKIKPIQSDINENQQKAKRMKTELTATPPYIPNNLQQLMTETPAQLPFPYTWIQQAMLYRLVQQGNLSPKIEEPTNTNQKPPRDIDVPTDSSGALDLSKNDVKDPDNSLKLDTPSSSSDEEEDNSTTMFANVEVVHNETPNEQKENPGTPVPSNSFSCQYCDISFGDAVLYTMHMGYHGFQDPFACNMCGEKCNDKVSFFLHIARTSHS